MQRRLGLTEEGARRITQAFNEAARAQQALAQAPQPGGQGLSPSQAFAALPGAGGTSAVNQSLQQQAQAAAQAAAAIQNVGAATQQVGSAWRIPGEAAVQSGHQMTAAADAARTAVTGLGTGLRTAGTQAAETQTAVAGLAGGLQTLVTAGGSFGSGAGLGGGVLGYIAGGLAVRGIEATAEAMGGLAREVVTQGDAWILLQQRIETTLHTTRDQADQLRQQLADQSRGIPLASSAQFASQAGPSLLERGFNQQDVLQITRTFEELAALSGTSSQAASRAAIQLSQAFALGKLQGQDLRAIIQDMPPLMDQLARSTGLSQQRLMEMAHAGQLSATVLADALLRSTTDVDAAFQGLSPTVGRASTDLANAWTEASGKAAEHSGLIREVATDYTALAGVVRSDAFTGGLTAIGRFFADIAKGARDSAAQIKAVTDAAQNVAHATVPQAFAAPNQSSLGEAAGHVRDLQGQRQELADLPPLLNLPILRSRAEERARQLADLDRQIAEAQQAVEREAKSAAFPLTRDPTGRPVGIVNPAGEGTAAGYAGKGVPVPTGLPESTQRIIEQQRTLTQLQEHLNTLRVAEAGIVKGSADEDVRRAAVQRDIADTVGKIATERKGENVEAYMRAYDVSREQATRELGLVNQVNQGLDARAQILARIHTLQNVRTFSQDPAHPDVDAAHAATQEIAQEQQKLAQLDAQRADTAARTRESLIGQADAMARYAAEEEKIARERRPTPQGDPAALRNAQDVALAQQGAEKRLFTGVEEEAAKAVAGATAVERVQAQIDAVQQVMGQRIETRAAGEAEINRLTAERGRLLERETAQIEAGAAADEKRLDQLRLINQRLQSGGGDIQARVQDAREAAEGQFPDYSPEQQRADPGAQAIRESRREEAGNLAASNEQLRARKEALQSLGIPQLAFTEQLHRLQEQLRAGFITWDQYAQAVNRARQAMVQATIQQHVGNLYAKGDPFSSKAGIGEQLGAGAQAAGIEWIQRYGNAAQAAGEAATAMGEAGVDAFAAWATGAQVSLPQIEQQLAQLVIKETMAFLISRALMAAFGATPGAGVPPGMAGAATTGLPAFGAGGGGGMGMPGMAVYHGGTRDVGSGGGIRVVEDPTVFLDAPRHHSGYNAFAADERPAVLRTGETVLDRQESRAYASGSQAPRVSLVINNHAGVQVRTSQRTEADGTVSLEAQLTSHQNNALVGGKSDKAMGQRFGLAKRLI